MASSHNCALHNALSRFRDNGDMADITIHCKTTQMELHKVVVCAQSPVLYKAFTSGFEESNGNIYRTDDDEPLLFTKMIDFFYTGDYDESGLENEQVSYSKLDFHANIFALADKYDAELLRKRAAEHYRHRLNKCDALEFLESISVVYGTTPSSLRSLRDVVINYTKTELHITAQEQEDVQDAFLNVVKEIPEFAVDVCADWIENSVRGSCSHCGPWQSLEICQARCLTCGKGGASAFKRRRMK